MDEIEAQFEVDGLEEPEPDRPAGSRRWWPLAVLAALVALLLVLVDLADDEPEAVPDPTPSVLPDPLPEPVITGSPGWSWEPVDVAWGSALVPFEGGVLVGNRTWNGSGGWSLVGWDGSLTRTALGQLPIGPVAAVGDDGRVWVAGQDIAGARVVVVDPTTGDQELVGVFAGERPLSIEVDDDEVLLLTDGGVAVWTEADGWGDVDRGSPDAVAARMSSAVYRASVAIQTGELDPPGPAVRATTLVRTSDGPGWSFLEACDGASCDRWSSPDGGGWARSPGLPGFPRWNGSEWWAGGPWAGRTEATVHLSSDGLAWEGVRVPDLSLATDEMVVPTVLPGEVVVLTLLRPDGTQEVFVGQRS